LTREDNRQKKKKEGKKRKKERKKKKKGKRRKKEKKKKKKKKKRKEKKKKKKHTPSEKWVDPHFKRRGVVSHQMPGTPAVEIENLRAGALNLGREELQNFP